MAFEKVSSESILKGKFRKDKAWTLIKDFSSYPNIMESIDDVQILEINDTEGKSEWSVTVEGAPLRWIEKDTFDNENFKLRFESVDGDFDTINGTWKIENFEHQGIKISFDIEYDLGIPVIEEVLGEVLKEKMKDNIDSMIHAVSNELSKDQVEEREFKRIPVHEKYPIRVNNTQLQTSIINISRGGMMFEYDGRPDLLNVNLKINGSTIPSDIVINDLKKKNFRAIFKEELSVDELKKLAGILTHRHLHVQDAVIVEEKVSTSVK